MAAVEQLIMDLEVQIIMDCLTKDLHLEVQ